MAIKIFAQIEFSIDERFSRVDNVSITLGDEAISQIAKAIAAQHSVRADLLCRCIKDYLGQIKFVNEACPEHGTQSV